MSHAHIILHEALSLGTSVCRRLYVSPQSGKRISKQNVHTAVAVCHHLTSYSKTILYDDHILYRASYLPSEATCQVQMCRPYDHMTR